VVLAALTSWRRRPVTGGRHFGCRSAGAAVAGHERGGRTCRLPPPLAADGASSVAA
jgi:hypothetical protein